MIGEADDGDALDLRELEVGLDRDRGRAAGAERQRHRFYRKFKYPLDKFYRAFCTGCGRCIRHCPVGIDIFEVLEEINKAQGSGHKAQE